MKRILVQFDGSNFYKKVKTSTPSVHLTNYQYRDLAQSIVKRKCDQIYYYVGEIRKYPNNKKSETLYANQQSLFLNLRKQNIEIKLGYLLFANGAYHEKGVDVHIAADMIFGAIKNLYDVCYLISSDTDLLPAIQIAREEGKKVVYVGFDKFISQALSKNCTSCIILNKYQIEKYKKHN